VIHSLNEKNLANSLTVQADTLSGHAVAVLYEYERVTGTQWAIQWGSRHRKSLRTPDL